MGREEWCFFYYFFAIFFLDSGKAGVRKEEVCYIGYKNSNVRIIFFSEKKNSIED